MGGEEAEHDQQSPLLLGFPSTMEPSESIKRTGTMWTAIAHIITGVIGAGVLSLAWSVAQLGWIAGPLLMIVFASVTIISNNILSDCYRYPDPYAPTRNRSYLDAVKLYLGDKLQIVTAVFVHESLYGSGIAYTITAAGSVNMYGIGIAYAFTTAISMRAILKSNCYHKEGHQASCTYGDTLYMLIFGAIQIVVSQIPDFHNMKWLSVIAAIMSFAYSFIGLGLGFAKVIENGSIKGSLSGVATSSFADKLWLMFQALGGIAFAYPYSIIVFEIQDTLKSPPAENHTMKRASVIAIFVTTLFYLCCGCFGYAAFGDDTPGNLLTGFGFYEPYWLIDFANACIVLHLVGGYQIFSQPVFAVAERWFSKKYPNSAFVNNFYGFKIPIFPRFQVNPFRLCFRTVYVISTTIIAILFPYFNQVLGVLGALNFWPLTIYFPVEMYFVQKKIGTWTKKWILLQAFSFVCFLVTVVGVIGSVEGLISAKLS